MRSGASSKQSARAHVRLPVTFWLIEAANSRSVAVRRRAAMFNSFNKKEKARKTQASEERHFAAIFARSQVQDQRPRCLWPQALRSVSQQKRLE